MFNAENKRLISCQTIDWYHSTLGGDQNADEAIAFIRSCGFDAIDYHFEGLYSYDEITSGVENPVYSLPLDKLFEYYTPLKNALNNPHK